MAGDKSIQKKEIIGFTDVDYHKDFKIAFHIDSAHDRAIFWKNRIKELKKHSGYVEDTNYEKWATEAILNSIPKIPEFDFNIDFKTSCTIKNLFERADFWNNRTKELQKHPDYVQESYYEKMAFSQFTASLKEASHKRFDFSSDRQIANEEKNIQKRLLFWLKRLKKYEQRPDSNTTISANYGRNVKAEIDFIKDQIEVETKRPIKEPDEHPRKTQSYSYKWQSNPEKELPELYKRMIDKFIDHTTTLEQFKAVFTGQPIKSINPLKWLDEKILLAYFIHLLIPNQKVRMNTNIWAIAKDCFQDATNLGQLNQSYGKNINELPKNHSQIDNLF